MERRNLPHDIGVLYVSNGWKKTFTKLRNKGADDSFQYSFSFLGFFFGPIYYLFKGMWAKGAVLCLIYSILAAALLVAEAIWMLELPPMTYAIASGSLFGTYAHFDYFRRVVHGEKMWRGWPSFMAHPFGVLLVLLLNALVVIVGTVASFMILEGDF